MKLTILERQRLLEIIPPSGNNLTIKILRKLRETLSPSEEELKTITVTYEYQCPYRNFDDDTGKMTTCENKGLFRERPTCGKHNLLMLPTGRMNLFIPPEVVNIEKEIHMGEEALKIVKDAYKVVDSENKRTEFLDDLYDKLFPPKEDKE